MGASRTSNKDILEAILAQNEAINTLASAIAGNHATAPAVTPEPVVTTEPERDIPSTLKVKPDYLSNRKVAAQDHANAKGENVVLYGRVNGKGEHKLAYCLKSRFASLRDKGLIGPVEEFEAS